jgi:Mg-chelatase subunit ChlD
MTHCPFVILRTGLAFAALTVACGGGAEGARSEPAQAGEAGSLAAPGAAAGASAAAPSALPAPDVAVIFQDGCATETARAELVPSNLLFVIDRSSSMKCNPPPTTSSVVCERDSARVDPAKPSKWDVVREALVAAIAKLPAETRAGLSYFSNDDTCGVYSMPSVPIAALSETQRSAINLSLDAVQPGGATPLAGATILAFQHLHRAAIEQTLTGNKFVVLLTDGEQSDACSDPARCSGAEECTELVEAEVSKAAGPGVGIKTFVIGAPGSEPARAVLSRMASLGGTGPAGCSVEQGTCHFDMTKRTDFGPALQEALANIAGRTLSCELPVPLSPGDGAEPARLNVVYSPGDRQPPRVILKDDRAACDQGAYGWQYTDDATRIRLCGQACSEVRRDPKARVDVVLGCPVRVPE